jgi:hypothetical protein
MKFEIKLSPNAEEDLDYIGDRVEVLAIGGFVA